MQDRETFTQEELNAIRNNPYVKDATAKAIHFTIAFKEEFWRLYNEECLSPKRIMRQLGFDIGVIGESRVRGIAQNVRKQANNGEAFRDVRKIPEKQAQISFEHQPPSKAIQKIQHKLAYLEQEMEFIKKNILADNEARRKR